MTDGGVLENYPIFAFDGPMCSMEAQHSILKMRGMIEEAAGTDSDVRSLFER